MRRLKLLVGAVVVAVALVSGASGSAGSVQAKWVVRDLGVLPGRVTSGAVDINESGQIVGASGADYGDGSQLAHAFLWRAGRMIDLGVLPGDSTSKAVDINNRGQAVGKSSMGSSGTGGHAFLWQRGKMIGLGTLGGPSSGAAAINDRGQIVGSADTTAKDEYGDPIQHAFLWQNGRMRDLGTLGGPSSGATAVNERGQVVGDSKTLGGEYRAFVWENGKMRDLGTLGGNDSFAGWINEHGQIVGTSREKGTRRHAFLFQSGRMTDLGTLPAAAGTWVESEAKAVNERGQVVGWSGPRVNGFLWQNGKMRKLATLSGYNGGLASAVNDQGQAIGYNVRDYQQEGRSQISSCYRAVVWKAGSVSDLGVLRGPRICGPQAGGSRASAINNHGQIVGGSQDHAVLWTLRRGT